jgi:hypothetical protein
MVITIGYSMGLATAVNETEKQFLAKSETIRWF